MRSWMIGLVLGIPPVALLPELPGLIVPFGLAGFGLLLIPVGTRGTQLCAGMAMGCALALWHGHALLQNRLPEECVRLPLQVSGQVSSLPRSSTLYDDTTRQRFEFVIASIAPLHCQVPKRLLLSYYGASRLVPGETWQFDVVLKKPWGLANPGSFNMQAWFAESRIDAVGSVRSGGAKRLAVATGARFLHHRLRGSISQRIDALPFDADVVAILQAITVADRSGIDARLWSLLQQFGINHLLVISGLHVGLVAGAGYLLGGLLVRAALVAGVAAHWLPSILALLFCSAYAALAGFSLSTQRALAMLVCFCVAGLVGRASASANNLLLAAAVVLILNPLAVLGSGLWLSFGAVAALLWLARWQAGMLRWRQLLWTHAFMSLVMLPMGAWWFGGSSLVAGFANLLMVPLIGMAVVPVALLAVLSHYLFPALSYWLWALAAWPLERVLPAARCLANSGSSWLYWHLVPGLPEVLLAGLGVMLFILPGARALRLLALLLVMPLVLPPLPVTARRSAAEPATTRVTVLDVGQGTSVLIQSGPRALLYDTGGGDPTGNNMASAVALPYIRRQGISRLDTLLVSHPDIDHSAGTTTLLSQLPVSRFLYGGELPEGSVGRPCLAGEAWQWPGGQRFRILSPGEEEGLSTNNGSCVLQIEAAGHRLLLAGDIDAAREKALVRQWGDQLLSDWLLLAHHGSKTSTSSAWLKAVQADHVIISSGYANRFGHPHVVVLERLERAGWRRETHVYNTASDGALEFKLAPGQSMEITRYRQKVKRFWM